MAQQVHAEIVNVGDIYHHREYNVARLSGDYGTEAELKKLTASLVREGWRMNGDGVIEVEKISKEWQERAVAELSAKWEALKEAAKADPKKLPDKQVFEALRTNKGKVIHPRFMGVSGNRRASVLESANLSRYTAEPSLPLITEIPVIVQTFANDKERVIAQMLENMGKLEGFEKPSEKDMLLCAKFLLAKGGIQDDIRRAFGATTGQKLYGLLTLDARFPKVRLLERMTNTDPTSPQFIRYGPIKGAALPRLVLRSDPQELAKFNAKERTAGHQELTPLTQEGLEEFLGTKTVNAPKIMERKNIEALSLQNPNVLVASVAKAIIHNNGDPLNKFIIHAASFNALDTLVDKAGPEMESILTALTKAPDLSVAIKSVRHALKV